MDNNELIMNRAIELALEAEKLGEVPVGAVIVDDNFNIVAEGFNRTITDHDPSAHAEIVALRKAGIKLSNYRLVDLSIYVTLEPCCMCVGALIHSRIKNVYFGAYDKKTGACSSVFSLSDDIRHNHHLNVNGGILENECAQILSSFFKRRRLEKKNAKLLYSS